MGNPEVSCLVRWQGTWFRKNAARWNFVRDCRLGESLWPVTFSNFLVPGKRGAFDVLSEGVLWGIYYLMVLFPRLMLYFEKSISLMSLFPGELYPAENWVDRRYKYLLIEPHAYLRCLIYLANLFPINCCYPYDTLVVSGISRGIISLFGF